MEKLVRVENVSFSYDKPNPFIKNISFNIEKGSYTCIVGANGSGKTTLARLLSGLLISDKGDVFIDGLKINRQNMKEIRKYIGVIFQNPDDQYIASSLKEDIIFSLENHNVNPLKMDEYINDIANKCQVHHLLDKDPNDMSGGEKQKGNLAGVLVTNPKILILDEAYSMLDSVSKKEFHEIIKSLNNEGMTIVSITHDIDEILISNKIIVMNEGNVVFDGDKGEFYRFKASDYGIELPRIMQLEKELGYEEFVDEKDFISKVGETL